MIKAVFIDIDETLTNSKNEVTLRTKKAIEECLQKGIKIILASGRSRQEAIKFQEQIGASPYIISSNGASCYDKMNHQEIYNNALKKEIVKKLFTYAVQNQYTIKLNYKDKLVLNVASYPDEKDKERTIAELENIIEKEEIVQCVITSSDIEKMRRFKVFVKRDLKQAKIENESKKLKNPNLKPSKNYYCDIISKEVSKGNAVWNLCQYLKLNKEEIITIGDGENDISMLELTQNSIAMGNALDHVKKVATYITDTNDDEGVAKVLEKLYM